MKKRINRREFMTKSASVILGTGLAVKGGLSFSHNQIQQSRVIEVFHPGAVLENLRINKKVVLHLIDGLEGCFDRGPALDSARVLFTPKTIWLGTDPVVLDAVGFRIIDAKRIEKGLAALKESDGYWSGPRPIDHIDLAAQKGIGISDLDRIKIEKINIQRIGD